MFCSKKRKPEIRELSGTEKKKDRVKIVIADIKASRGGYLFNRKISLFLSSEETKKSLKRVIRVNCNIQSNIQFKLLNWVGGVFKCQEPDNLDWPAVLRQDLQILLH